MARNQQEKFERKVHLEQLVDFFLEDGIQKVKGGFGETVADGVPSEEKRDVHLKHIGRSLAHTGDELWAHGKHQVSKDAVQSHFEAVMKAGRSLSKEEEEQHWQRFKEIMEKALKDTGADDAYLIAATVFVSIRGLAVMGSAVRSLVQRFSLRFLDEKKLREDIERISQIENTGHEDLD